MKLNLKDDLKLEKIIGKSGEGPGDLNGPVSLSIWQEELVVRDQIGYSIYALEGNFKQRFRAFTSDISFVYLDNTIYTVNPHPEEHFLIEVYGKDGKKLFDFGDKLIRPRYEIFRGLSPFAVINNVYQGSLL